MKKNLFMVAAVALMALVSCSKEDFNDGVQGGASDIVFSAELEQPVGLPAAEQAEIQSKTSLGEAVNNVRPVSWVAGDQIKVNGVTFSAVSTGAKTNFTTASSFASASAYFAVYPASATSKSDHSAIVIPASQDGSFAKAAISVAKSTTTSLSFKNVASIIKFQVPANCSTVTISSDQNLAGTFPVTFENNLPKIGTVSSASKTITLTGSFTTSGEYYVAVLPGSHKFTFRLDGYLSKASTKAVTASRANIANLKTLPALVASAWRLVGNFGGKDKWDISAGSIPMYKDEAANTYVAKDVTLTANDVWKFNKDNKWDEWVGSYASNYSDSEVYKTMQNHTSSSNAYGTHHTWGDYKSNFGAAAGTYDIYLYVVANKYGDAKVWVVKK